MRPLDDYIKVQLNKHLESMEKTLDADMLAIIKSNTTWS